MSLVQRTLASGVGFTEGPVIRPNGEIIFTSIDQGKLYKIPSVKGGACTVFADLGGGPNGATEGRDGTIYVTQSGGRWGRNKTPDWSLESGIQAVKPDGKVSWISTDPVAPNDLCFGPDGWLYCTDPTRYRSPRNDGRLFRIKVETGEAQLLCSVDWYPNGLGFGAEDDILYVADAANGRIVKMPLNGFMDKKQEIFIQMEHGHTPDGFLFDAEGNIVTSANSHDEGPGEIQTYDRKGKLVDIYTPGDGKSYTNVALDDAKVLVITDSTNGNTLAVDNWPTAGMKLHPFR